jgi:molybdopterin converting factor subunit 1
MKITVSFFAQSREIVGKNQMEIELPEGEDASGLLKRLQVLFHGLDDINIMMAVNTEYVGNSYRLHDGDKVALIPPINGG